MFTTVWPFSDRHSHILLYFHLPARLQKYAMQSVQLTPPKCPLPLVCLLLPALMLTLKALLIALCRLASLAFIHTNWWVRCDCICFFTFEFFSDTTCRAEHIFFSPFLSVHFFRYFYRELFLALFCFSHKHLCILFTINALLFLNCELPLLSVVSLVQLLIKKITITITC